MDFIYDIEKIISDYLDPKTYQNLIKTNPKLYNWNVYIKTHNCKFEDAIKYKNIGLYNSLLKQCDLTFNDIRIIVQTDNIKFLKIAIKKYPYLIFFDLFFDAMDYDSYKCISFLIDTFEISYEQYNELLTICVDYDDLGMLKLLNKKIPINIDDLESLINIAKIYKNKKIVKFLSSLYIFEI